MGVTIVDIAKRVHASKMTVSQALRGVGRVSQDTRSRVLQAARELGYRPNAAAQATSTGRFGCIALLLGNPTGTSTLSERMLRGMHAVLAADDIHLTVAVLPEGDDNQADPTPKILRQTMADGLLVNYTHGMPRRMAKLIQSQPAPAVWINTKRPFDCVYPDDYGAGKAAAQHLLSLGHRKIAFVDYSHRLDEIAQEHYSATDRRNGYAAAMAEAGLEPRVIYRCGPGFRGHFDWSAAWLRTEGRPTAVVCYSGKMAASIAAAALSMGMQLPRDLSLVCFDPFPVSHMGPVIATFIVPEFELGEMAVKALLRKIEKPTIRLAATQVPFAFAGGASCVPPLNGESRLKLSLS
jgi:LacI family transcriptional regulator